MYVCMYTYMYIYVYICIYIYIYISIYIRVNITIIIIIIIIIITFTYRINAGGRRNGGKEIDLTGIKMYKKLYILIYIIDLICIYIQMNT
jgi:hypothetical protein